VALLASEGFRGPAKPLPQAQGMVVASPFLPPQLLPEPGKAFVREFYAAVRERIEPQSAYAAQAAEVVLRAMEESDGTRAGIRDALFGMQVEDGLVGDFEIDENGDAVGLPVALYRLQAGANAYLTITPPAELVEAAAG
jgi:ABC-type branched-subunit amino acid transport system substrate-binding protein